MPLNIVLVEPQIPQNTGNIARLTAATYTKLHLVEPLGFELSDRYLKRAGLDYWPEVQLTVHPSWKCFLEAEGPKESALWFFTTKSEQSLYDISFSENDYLILGSETQGISEEMHKQYETRRFRIPMENPNVRSLNLANAAAICLFEARRQTNHFKKKNTLSS